MWCQYAKGKLIFLAYSKCHFWKATDMFQLCIVYKLWYTYDLFNTSLFHFCERQNWCRTTLSLHEQKAPMKSLNNWGSGHVKITLQFFCLSWGPILHKCEEIGKIDPWSQSWSRVPWQWRCLVRLSRYIIKPIYNVMGICLVVFRVPRNTVAFIYPLTPIRNRRHRSLRNYYNFFLQSDTYY